MFVSPILTGGRASHPLPALVLSNNIRRPSRSLNLPILSFFRSKENSHKVWWLLSLAWSLLFLSEVACAQKVSVDSFATQVFIFKERQVLQLYNNGNLQKTYRICLGINPKGPKRIQGDSKTPEGEYFVCSKNVSSRFHRFLGLSYPGVADAQWAFETGRICLDDRDSIISQLNKGLAPPWDTPLGGWVGIHGYPTGSYENKWTLLLYPKPHNWTDGCIAMWNFEIEELFGSVPLNTPVRIEP